MGGRQLIFWLSRRISEHAAVELVEASDEHFRASHVVESYLTDKEGDGD